jgi:hypothetical protein
MVTMKDKWLDVARIGGLAMIVFLIAACKPAVTSGPGGRITLEYEGLRNNGMSVSDVYFILENRSTRVIYFRADKAFFSGTVDPVYTALDCTDPNHPEVAEYSSFPLVEFASGPPPFVKVSPGERLRLNVADPGNKIAQHRGHICRLRLQLKDDEEIESEPFKPIIAF